MDVDALLAAARAHPFTGWDFSWLGARMRSNDRGTTRRSCSMPRASSPDLLDLGTGGGEWLGELPAAARRGRSRPKRGRRTLPGAARNLRAIGVPVVQDEGAADNERQADADADPRGRLPFRTGVFRLIVNRHEAFVGSEVARVLAPNGTFVTQQVDNGNLDDLYQLLERTARAPTLPSWLPLAVEQVRGSGPRDRRRRARGMETYRFADVGALAWYVAAVGPQHPEWADFTIDRYYDDLVRLDDTRPRRTSARAPATALARAGVPPFALTALELRGPLLRERARAFLCVLGSHDGHAERLLPLERFRLAHVLGLAQRAQDRFDRERPVGADHRRDLARLRERLAVGHDVADESELLGLGRGDVACR